MQLIASLGACDLGYNLTIGFREQRKTVYMKHLQSSFAYDDWVNVVVLFSDPFCVVSGRDVFCLKFSSPEVHAASAFSSVSHCDQKKEHVRITWEQLQNAGPLWSNLFTCVGTLYRTRRFPKMSLHTTRTSNFSCPKCNKTWKHPITLLEHMQVCKTLKCHECDKYFTCKRALTRHKKHHSGEKRVSCPSCDKSFANKSTLKKHQVVHSGVKPFHCRQCDKCFATKSVLSRHEIYIHSVVKPFNCHQCDKCFASMKQLSQHEIIHSDVKPYKCSHCDKSFVVRCRLTQHVRVHTDERPHKCPHCDKACKSKQGLEYHIRTHTGEIARPYKCSLCDLRCIHYSQLKSHIRTHTIVNGLNPKEETTEQTTDHILVKSRLNAFIVAKITLKDETANIT